MRDEEQGGISLRRLAGEYIFQAYLRYDNRVESGKECSAQDPLRLRVRAYLGRAHPSRTRYAHQQQLLVLIDADIWVVPFVEQDGGIFLKTMFPSRKATRTFMGKES